MRRPLTTAALLAASALVLAACATPAGGRSPAGSDAPAGLRLGTVTPKPPDGEVTAQGTVMEKGGTVELCLGAILDSYPPQCRGIPISNWSWDGVEGSESASGSRWGAYAVHGTFDGTAFTLTRTPMMLALFDPAPMDDPFGGVPGTADEKTLLGIQEELPARLGASLFTSGPADGRLWVQVLWDDGTWQKAADDDFGAGVVVIRPALHPVR